MEQIDLLDELHVALASLAAHLPCDLLRVFADYSPRGACQRCQLEPPSVGFSFCNCQAESELRGMDGLASAAIWMGMTLVVRARGCDEAGFVFIRAGLRRSAVSPGDSLAPFVDARGARDRRNPAANGIWSRGELRSQLVASILREAVACGCTTIAYQGSGRYVRTDTGQVLADDRMNHMFDSD